MLQQFSVNMCVGQRMDYHASVPCNHPVMKIMVKFCTAWERLGTAQAHVQCLSLLLRFC